MYGLSFFEEGVCEHGLKAIYEGNEQKSTLPCKLRGASNAVCEQAGGKVGWPEDANNKLKQVRAHLHRNKMRQRTRGSCNVLISGTTAAKQT